MSEQHADSHLTSTLRAALTARDARERAPSFQASIAPRGRRGAWPAAAAPAAALGVFALAVVLMAPDGPWRTAEAPDLALARELSSPEYWRGPTDRLLARNGADNAAVFPALPDYEVSLEESWL